MRINNHPAMLKKMSPQLLVTSLDQSIAFYAGKLGFELEFQHEDFYAGVIKDGCSIHLKLGQPNADERKRKRENNDLDIVFSVYNVEALYNQLLTSSVEIIQPLCEQPYGTEFYIADPDGYIIAFLQRYFVRNACFSGTG